MGYIYRRKRKLPDGSVIETGPPWIKYYRNGQPQGESSEELRANKLFPRGRGIDPNHEGLDFTNMG